MNANPDSAGPGKSQSLGTRLLLSHMTVASIGLAMLGVIFLFTFYLRQQSSKLARVDAPMAQASRVAIEGIEQSLASLRGWVVMDDPEFKTNRHKAWAEKIDPSMALLVELDQGVDAESLARTRRLLSELKETQWWIEDTARTPGNEPARDIYTGRLQPVMNDVFGLISALIDLEKAADDPGRSNRMLGAMADFRGFFARSLASLGNYVQTGDTADKMAFRDQLAVAGKRLGDLREDTGNLDPEQRVLLDRIAEQLPLYSALAGEIVSLRENQEWNIAQFLLRNEAVPKSRQISERLTSMATERTREMNESAQHLAFLSNAAIGICGLFFLIMAISAWFVSRRGAAQILRPVSRLSGATRLMAAGELGEDIPVTSNDELGELTRSFNTLKKNLNQTAEFARKISQGDLTAKPVVLSEKDTLGHALVEMLENLRKMVLQISGFISNVNSSCGQLNDVAANICEGATNQAGSVTETTATMEEVRQTAEVAAGVARDVAEAATGALEDSRGGQSATAESIEGMKQIRFQMESIADSMVRLSEHNLAIGQIIATVDDFAEQSKLLAFNATIEAAKAGEHGKGFAVVASEVKALADQSRDATSQVRRILSDIQKATSAAVTATEQGSLVVEDGVTQSGQAGSAIENLADSIGGAADSANQIAASSQQQLVGVGQVTQAMEGIKQASTRNVESASQLETAAQDLHDLGQTLKNLIDQFVT